MVWEWDTLIIVIKSVKRKYVPKLLNNFILYILVYKIYIFENITAIMKYLFIHRI